ncbi:MAG TPA: TrbG/VirB9 family P-type conjugative transfer protein [Novosphingobium sp.]|mgnify:FL=1|nr:TrbG/VirB9 family P-type conjugative transfer protein [Novosphingobium sp.]
MTRPLLHRAAPAALLALGLSFAAPAQAGDARLATRLFHPDEVVRIDGRLGVQATIAFAEDEHIENVAIGDSTTWQVTPNKRANLLFVKPLAAKARTNMTVVTDRRTYFFDLVAAAQGLPVYVLRFTYQEEKKPEAPAQVAGQALTPEESRAVSSQQQDRPVDPTNLNFAWRMKGKAALLPSRIYDDGNATYLTWPARTPIPAIQIRNETGAEGPVNFAVRGDVIVVEGTHGLIVLRSGKDSATLENLAAGKGEVPTPAGEGSALAAAPEPTPAKDR